MKEKIKILHLITSLDVGGAELLLFHLLKNLDKEQFDNHVVSMIAPGKVAKKIKDLGIQVDTLGMSSGVISISSFNRLWKLIKFINPDIIQTWLYHADFMGGIAGALSRKPVIWAIHNTSLDPRYVKKNTIRIAKANAILSNFIPRKIIIVSETSKKAHIQLGFAVDKFTFIPNGYDLSTFFPDIDAGRTIRNELQINPETILIGLVARFDPLKDHELFIKAAGLLLKQRPEVHFLLCGRSITNENRLLKSWISQTGFASNIHLLGHRDDISKIMNALDINTLSSIAEAFPNVIGEAMACGVPNVATNVGDIAFLVGDTGLIVPPKDPFALVEGWLKILNLDLEKRREIGARARHRIEQEFNIVNIAEQYATLYKLIFKPVSSNNQL